MTSRQAAGFTFYALDAAGAARAAAGLADLLDMATLPAAALPGGGSGCCR